MVPLFVVPGRSFVSGESGASELSFKAGNLKVAVEIDGGGGFVFVDVAVGGGELRLEGVNPKRLFGAILQGERHRDEKHALAGNLGGGDEIDRAPSLRFGTLVEGDDRHYDGHRGDADQDNSSGRQIALGGSKFLANVEVGRLSGSGCRSGGGHGGRWIRDLVGHQLIVEFDPGIREVGAGEPPTIARNAVARVPPSPLKSRLSGP